ncbi:MAG: hypothetical protein PVG12_11080 [Gammaproteobacteria bacterium]
MKVMPTFLCLLMPTLVFAQKYPAMNEADMQQMMQQMGQMQSCMEKVDQAKLQALGERSQQMEAEIKSLCTSGKRDEAQQKAIAFGREIANDAAMKAMMKCTEGMQSMMPEMPFKGLDEETADQQICDLM